MNISKSDLLTLLISLFIFSACQKPNTIGLKTDSKNTISGFFTDAVTLTTTTVLDNDPIPTRSLSKYPCGTLNDPVFGITTSNLLLSLNLPGNNLQFGSSPTLDSAVLVLNYVKDYYGDLSSNFKFEVYQLQEQLTSFSNLYNTNTAGTNSTNLVDASQQNFPILTDKQVLITPISGEVTGDKKEIAPHARIRINPSFIQSNFFNASSTKFTDNNSFNNFIKGLYVKATPVTGRGGIVFFDLSTTGNSRLELYYKNTGSSAIKYVTFPIQNAPNPVISAFNHTYASTEIQTHLNNPNINYDYTFVQPMAGIRTRINPDLNSLKALGNIVVNKAELVISAQTLPTDISSIFTPAPRLFLYRADIAGQKQFISDYNGSGDLRSSSDILFGGIYNSEEKKYRFTITSYVQDLINGNSKQYGIYVSVVDAKVTKDNILPSSATTAGRVVIGSGQTSSPYKMKLNIIYNKVN